MFFSNAKEGKNGLFYYIFTIILTILGYVFGQVFLYLAMWMSMSIHNDIGIAELENFSKNPDFSLLHIDKNLGLVLILLTFVVALFALYIGVRYVHKRRFLSVISSDTKLDWNRILWSTSVWFGLLAVIEIGFYFKNPEYYTFRDPEVSFIFLILISLFILPIQTAFEEIFTRGYIFQAVAYNSKSIMLGFVVSVIVFALLHGMNPETVKYGFWQMMSYYLSAAILLGLIVVFDKRLEIAIGVHTATNIFGALIVTYDSAALQTDSLFIVSEINPVILAIEITILGVIFLFIAAKKYKWNISKAFKFDIND